MLCFVAVISWVHIGFMRYFYPYSSESLQWRHNEDHGISNHQLHDCLLNRVFRRRSKNESKLRVTGFRAGNSPAKYPAQRASNAANVSIWWRHHGCFTNTVVNVMGNHKINLMANRVHIAWNVLYIDSLWPSDTIWRHNSGSTLARVMACCLTAPSHYLNWCWLIISKVQWHPSESNFTRDTSVIRQCN